MIRERFALDANILVYLEYNDISKRKTAEVLIDKYDFRFSTALLLSLQSSSPI